MSQPIDDGGPAFPTMDPNEHYRLMGMTLRDYFAAAALQGFISDTSIPASIKVDATLLSRSAFQVADAMLKARGGQMSDADHAADLLLWREQEVKP